MSSVAWIISIVVLLLLVIVVGIYMSAPEEVTVYLKKLRLKKPKGERKEPAGGTDQKEILRKSIAKEREEPENMGIPPHVAKERTKERVHENIIGPSKTNINDYVYTKGEIPKELELNGDGLNGDEFNTSTPEELAKMGIDANELNEGLEVWDSTELTAEDTKVSDYNTIMKAIFDKGLSEKALEEVFALIDKLSGTEFIESVKDYMTESYANNQEKINELVLKQIQGVLK